MKIDYGKGTTKYGPGVDIDLTSGELVEAINQYLKNKEVEIKGIATVTINGDLIFSANIYVDPSGIVMTKNETYFGRGKRDNLIEGELYWVNIDDPLYEKRSNWILTRMENNKFVSDFSSGYREFNIVDIVYWKHIPKPE